MILRNYEIQKCENGMHQMRLLLFLNMRKDHSSGVGSNRVWATISVQHRYAHPLKNTVLVSFLYVKEDPTTLLYILSCLNVRNLSQIITHSELKKQGEC